MTYMHKNKREQDILRKNIPMGYVETGTNS